MTLRLSQPGSREERHGPCTVVAQHPVGTTQPPANDMRSKSYQKHNARAGCCTTSVGTLIRREPETNAGSSCGQRKNDAVERARLVTSLKPNNKPSTASSNHNGFP